MELDKMLRKGIVEPVTEPSLCISAQVVVLNANGKVRIYIDKNYLNRALK